MVKARMISSSTGMEDMDIEEEVLVLKLEVAFLQLAGWVHETG